MGGLATALVVVMVALGAVALVAVLGARRRAPSASEPNEELVRDSDVVVLSVKPQVIDKVLEAIGKDIKPTQLVISVEPDSIPEAFEVSVAGLNIGDALEASVIKLPQGAKLTVGSDATVVTIAPPKVEVEAEVAEEGAEEAAAAKE